jgi:hypothetical protein
MAEAVRVKNSWLDCGLQRASVTAKVEGSVEVFKAEAFEAE